jgi:hypothetical protein
VRIGLVLPLLLLAACRQPAEAPTELDDLARYLFQHFEDQEPEALAAGLDNLAPLLLDAPDEGWSLSPLATEELADIAPPQGREPGDCQGLAVVYQSLHPVQDHTALMLLEDMTPASPTADSYERSFTEGQHCFGDASCEFLRTVNAIYRSNILMEMGFTLREDYRWVGDAVLSRNWLPESGHGEEGNNHLWQDYELEVWLPVDGGGTRRLWSMWTEAEYVGVSDELAESTGRAALVNAMEAQDAWLEQAR